MGYNLRRKMVLLSIWALLPMAIYMHPGLFGLLPEHEGWYEFLRAVGTAWLYLGIGALLFRTVSGAKLPDINPVPHWVTYFAALAICWAIANRAPSTT